MDYATPTNEWNREARRAAEAMAAFRSSSVGSKDTDGYMVVIGDQLRKSDAVFIGWAFDGAVGELLELVQFGCPFPLVVRCWLPATIAEVETYQAALKLFRCRTDDSNWISLTPEVENYIQRIRKSVKASCAKVEKRAATIEAKGSKSPAFKKDAAQQRRRNKRSPNRRRH